MGERNGGRGRIVRRDYAGSDRVISTVSGVLNPRPWRNIPCRSGHDALTGTGETKGTGRRSDRARTVPLDSALAQGPDPAPIGDAVGGH